MPVAVPGWNCPVLLGEEGPPEDPTLLLAATAHIGNAAVTIIAVRVDPGRRAAPDYRPDLPRGCYQGKGYDEILDAVLEELDYASERLGGLLGAHQPNILDLPTGPYRIWILPLTFNRDS